MKLKTIWLGALCVPMLLLAGCATPDVDLVNAQTRNEMPREAKELNCVACHSMDSKVVGPAWKDVGQRYRSAASFEYNGKSYPLVEGMIKKVSHGGAGHWGMMPMPANDPAEVKREKIEKLVRLVLNLRQD